MKKYNWITTIGQFDVNSDNIIKYIGGPHEYPNQETGEKEIGAKVGNILSDQKFNEGSISLDVEFDDIDSRTSCEIIFYYDPSSEGYLSAGISAGGGMYGIKSFFKPFDQPNYKIEYYKQSGDHNNLKPKKIYALKLIIKGTKITLTLDGVEVINYLLPLNLKKTQVGLFCMSQTKITIRNFSINSENPNVFMITSLSDKYNEIYEDVIKEVCSSKDFELQTVKADEIYGPGVILSDIIKFINESKFVIAEISPDNESSFNANVFYEIGYAHALGKQIILIAKKGTKLPFDISPFRVLFYEDTIAGKKKIQLGLTKHLNSLMESI